MAKAKTKLCKHCNQEIAVSAKSCPHCGGKNSKPIYKRVWFIALVVIVVIAAVGGALGGEDEVDKSKIEYTKYEISDMNKDLDDNPASALDKYKDQYVSFSGKLAVIDSEGSYITITDPDDDWDIIGIQCYIKNDDQLDVVKSAKVGDKLTIKGKVTDVGEIIGYQLDMDEISAN